MSESPWHEGAEKEREWLDHAGDAWVERMKEVTDDPVKGRAVVKHFRKHAKKLRRKGDPLADYFEVNADMIERALKGDDWESIANDSCERLDRLNKARGVKSSGEILGSARQ